MNAALFGVGAASVFCFGPSFLLYVAGAYIASSAAGAYCEEKINEYDRVLRRRAKEVTGNDQPGDSEDTASLIGSTVRNLGPFLPVVPVIAAGAGAYYSHQAKMMEAKAYEKENKREYKLRSGFTSRGAYKY